MDSVAWILYFRVIFACIFSFITFKERVYGKFTFLQHFLVFKYQKNVAIWKELGILKIYKAR